MVWCDTFRTISLGCYLPGYYQLPSLLYLLPLLLPSKIQKSRLGPWQYINGGEGELGPGFMHLNKPLCEKKASPCWCFSLFMTLGIYRVKRQPADQKFTCLATEASTKPHWLFWHRKSSFYLVKIAGDVSIGILSNTHINHMRRAVKKLWYRRKVQWEFTQLKGADQNQAWKLQDRIRKVKSRLKVDKTILGSSKTQAHFPGNL